MQRTKRPSRAGLHWLLWAALLGGVFCTPVFAAPKASASAALTISPREIIEAELERRVEAGDLGAMVGLADLRVDLGGSIADALNLLRRAGDQGLPCAYLNAARVARTVMLDTVSADSYVERALTLGCVEARYEAAMSLLANNRDRDRAIALLEDASEVGDQRALLYLGRAQIGEDSAINETRATNYLRRAAVGGSPEAQGELVQLFMNVPPGSSVRPSALREALYWALILADRGGEAARIQARSIEQLAATILETEELATVRRASAQFQNGSFTLPAASEPNARRRY